MSQQALDALGRILVDLKNRYARGDGCCGNGAVAIRLKSKQLTGFARSSDDLRRRAALELRELVVVAHRGM